MAGIDREPRSKSEELMQVRHQRWHSQARHDATLDPFAAPYRSTARKGKL